MGGCHEPFMPRLPPRQSGRESGRVGKTPKPRLIRPIDLLAAGVIAGVTLAALLPALSRCRAQVHRRVCLSHVEQITRACLAYAHDWDDTCPLRLCDVKRPGNPPRWGKRVNWDQAVGPYVADPRIFKCPSVDATTGYSINCERNIGSICCRGEADLLRLEDVPDPAATIWLAEATMSRHRVCPLDHPSTSKYCKAVEHTRHLGGANYGFLDGHAKWLRYSETLAPANLWTLEADD